jgi:shikimate 5-dehydrogenase
MVTEREPRAQQAGAADLIAHQAEKWHGFHLLDRAAVAALENALRARSSAEKPLAGRTVMLVGVNGTTRVLGHRILKHGGIPIVASRHRQAAQDLAQELQCRQVQFEAVYSTLHDVLVLCCEEPLTGAAAAGGRSGALHTGYLKAGMAVVDLTALSSKSALLREAEQRGCVVVLPAQVLLEQVLRQVKLITGEEGPRERLQEVLAALLSEDEE